MKYLKYFLLKLKQQLSNINIVMKLSPLQWWPSSFLPQTLTLWQEGHTLQRSWQESVKKTKTKTRIIIILIILFVYFLFCDINLSLWPKALFSYLWFMVPHTDTAIVQTGQHPWLGRVKVHALHSVRPRCQSPLYVQPQRLQKRHERIVTGCEYAYYLLHKRTATLVDFVNVSSSSRQC